jgi:uncharacterized surface protein with fasciclin (FAS1) repeats
MPIRPLALLFAVGAFALAAPAALACDTCGCQGHTHAETEMPDLVDVAVAAGSFDTLVEAVQAAGLVDTLKGEGPFTVFAPTDAAFATIPAETLQALLGDREALTEVLTYHVVSGLVPASDVVALDWAETVSGSAARVRVEDGEVFIDDARVVQTDIQASNGIIHVIDAVIQPRPDIVETAVAAGAFETLVTAVKAADLVETLQGKGPFTVFAPSDAAFAALPEGTIPSLLRDKTALTGVLTYHVVSGRILAEDIPVGETNIATVNGQTLRIVKNERGEVTIDGARVVTADVLAGNGVIHVIDAVVLPRQ